MPLHVRAPSGKQPPSHAEDSKAPSQQPVSASSRQSSPLKSTPRSEANPLVQPFTTSPPHEQLAESYMQLREQRLRQQAQ